jgi:hypothetical protein
MAPLDGTAHGWRKRNKDDLVTLAVYGENPVAVLLAEVRDVAASGLENTKPQQTQHRDECEVAAVGRLLRGGQHGLELQVRQT